MSDSVRRYRVPFCIVLFGDADQAKGFSRAVANLILIWHKDRSPVENEDKGKIEASDVRFDLKDWSAIRFGEPNALRKDLVAALVRHYSPLNA